MPRKLKEKILEDDSIELVDDFKKVLEDQEYNQCPHCSKSIYLTEKPKTHKLTVREKIGIWLAL